MRLIAMTRSPAALAALVLLGACSGVPAEQPGEAGPTPTPTASASVAAQPSATSEPVPGPPTGSRWVGVADLVFAVPLDWRIETAACAEPDGDVVHFLGRGSVLGDCAAVPTVGVDSLVVAPAELTGQSRDLRRMDRAFNVDGIVVRHSAPACHGGADKGCDVAFGVVDLDTIFRLSYSGPHPRTFVEGLLDSASRLPPGATTVPFLELGTSVEDARRSFERAGLVGDFPDVDFPHYVVETQPAAGSVVPVGSTVEVMIGDG